MNAPKQEVPTPPSPDNQRHIGVVLLPNAQRDPVPITPVSIVDEQPVGHRPLPEAAFDPAELAEQKQREASEHWELNPVTGLPAYRRFKSVAGDLVDIKSGQFSFIYSDVDGLKEANESGDGHEGGNELLNQFGENLLNSSALADASSDQLGAKVFHIHGDEFVIIVGENDESRLIDLEHKLEEKMEELGTPASFGAMVHRDGVSLDQLLQAVDVKMLERKEERKAARRAEQVAALPIGKRVVHHVNETTDTAARKLTGIKPESDRGI